jgi:hypothetical protein
LGLGVLTSVAPANAADVLYVGDGTDSGAFGALTGSYCSAVDNVGATATATAAATGSLNIVMPVGGRISLAIAATGDHVKVTAPAIITSAATAADIVAGSGGAKALASADAELITIGAGAAGTSYLYNYGTDATYTTALSTVVIVVVAACANSTYSPADSYVRITTDGAAPGTSNIDAATSAAVGSSLYVSLQGRNGYGAILPAGTWKATATNGALLAIGTTAPSAKGTVSTVTLAATNGTRIAVRVNPASTAAGAQTTVTISYNDVVVATKSMTFQGDQSKIVISDLKSGANGGTGSFKFKVYDAAGNRVSSTDPALDPLTASPRTGSITVTTSTTATTTGVATFPCSTTSGSTTSAIQFYSSYASALISTPVTLVCAGGIDTYSISLDKAAYKVGDIATLTITAKDSTGAAVNDSVVFDSTKTATNASAISVPGTTAVQTPLNGDSFVGGVLSYRFSVTTAGTWNASVYTTDASTTKSAQSTAYTVASSGGTTNEDVLKAIVSLIASINKQIAALQKALLKK